MKSQVAGISRISWREGTHWTERQPNFFFGNSSGAFAGENKLHRFSKYTLQTLGFALIVLGIPLIIISSFNSTPSSFCPFNGWPPHNSMLTLALLLTMVSRSKNSSGCVTYYSSPAGSSTYLSAEGLESWLSFVSSRSDGSFLAR